MTSFPGMLVGDRTSVKIVTWLVATTIGRVVGPGVRAVRSTP